MTTPVFYYDLASPYAYLASLRVDRLLGPGTEWRGILVGAVHRRFRRVSWGATPELRAAGVHEIEARAAALDAPPFVWPTPYPANTLGAMRAATWATDRGAGRAFAQAAFAAAFAQGRDLTERRELLAVAEDTGLPASDLDEALDGEELKRRLRSATDAAIAAGVYGVPTFDAAGLLWWGDDRLDAAARFHAAR